MRPPHFPPQPAPLKRSIMMSRDATHPNELRDHAFRRVILSIPPGKVSTYGAVAAASGYPLYHRAVARLLRSDPPDSLPWHRIVGAGGHIKLRDAAAVEQHARLLLEGVHFLGTPANPTKAKIDMARCSHTLHPWDPPPQGFPND